MSGPSGLLLVDKDAGATSHDAVAAVRRALSERRVGHAGTLDPMATGLLVVAVGPATRLLRYAQAQPKRYVGVARLGVATDSLDADGAEVARASVPAIDDASLAAAAVGLTGRQSQVPPMVSAIKVGGKRLYELARDGVEVERAPRDVEVYELTVRRSGPEELAFEVACSTGTYVRVLLADLALRLGTLAHLTALRRTAIGALRVEDALGVAELNARARAGEVSLRPSVDLLGAMARVTLDDERVTAVRRGQRVDVDADAPEVAALDESGRLVAVLARRSDRYQPIVVLGVGARDG
ncbi:MAG TPA: tRNA pseudouridine(55) synthase TruB [Acidimicrobiales bacterium]|nr:tRNA pseudouridine(55) synthase TruB [Acidimicrobiales bacterium]